MLEIIAIILLGKKLAEIAQQKGQSRRKWRLLFLLGWIGAELIGAAIGLLLFQQMFPAMLIGIGCAITVYILMRDHLQSLPDEITRTTVDELGR